MKRTTYIFIGLFISGLVVFAAMVFAIYMTIEERSHDQFKMEGEFTEMSLQGIRMLEVSVNQQTDPKKIVQMSFNEGIRITPPAEAGKASVTYPQSPYLKVDVKNDTLSVRFDFSRIEHAAFFIIDKMNIRLAVDSLTHITASTACFPLEMKHMKSDSLCIHTASAVEISVDSCQYRSLDVAGDRSSLFVKNSRIENCYLNLDNFGTWTFENSKIGTEYLSGSGNHRSEYYKGECRRIVWNPLKEDAKLHLTVREKTTMVLEP